MRSFALHRRRVTIAVLSLAVLSFTVLQSFVIPVLPRIQTQFDTDQNTVTWVLTAYLLSASVCTPLLGRFGDVVGRRTMLVAALGALSVGSLLAALAPTIGWLIASRVLQGAGGCVLPLTFGIIRDEFPESMTGLLARIASLGAAGFGLGIVSAGTIVTNLGYSWLFWLPAMTTAAAALLAAFCVPQQRKRDSQRPPISLAVLLALWLTALLLGVSQGNDWGWVSSRTLGLFTAAAVLFVFWVWFETRAPIPLIDMKMMSRRGVWTANVVAFATGFGNFPFFAFLPQMLQAPVSSGYGFGATITASGYVLLPSSLASFVVGMGTGHLVGRFGSRNVVMAGVALSVAAYGCAGAWHDHVWQLYVSTATHGVGAGLIFSSMASVVVLAVPSHQSGVASGMNANVRTIGGSIGTALVGAIIVARPGPSAMPRESGYEAGMWVLAVVAAVSLLAAIYMPKDRSAVQPAVAHLDGADVGVFARPDRMLPP